jgi:putative ABC transport system ATP-binding protein
MSLLLQNIHKNYSQGTSEIQVLKGLMAEIKSGEIVAVVGQSGSGKSTLLSLLAGLDRPQQGHIIIRGQDIVGLSEQQMTSFRAKNIGIVFQHFHLMPHLTALENVMLPLEILGEEQIEARAREILGLMGLGHREEHFPSQLSGGESQRVAIARALVVQPQFLLADEPSGSLDSETGEKVMDVFFDVVRQKKMTTVLVTHSDPLARRCDRILTLKNGLLQ